MALIIAEKIKDIVELEMKKREQDFEFHIYERGNDFLKADILGEELIFMDIEMPGISGIEVAEQLREYRRNENLILLKDGVVLEELKKTGSREEFYQEIIQKMEIL